MPLLSLGASPIFDPVTPAGNVDDLRVMQEAIQDGGGGRNIADEFAPFLDGPVGGHHGGAFLVATHDDLEEIFP